MPYVWVDEYECGGYCQRAEDAHAAMREAIIALKTGDDDAAAHILLVAIGDREAKREREKERESAALYQSWIDAPKPRPDFLTFAHKRRKYTAS